MQVIGVVSLARCYRSAYINYIWFDKTNGAFGSSNIADYFNHEFGNSEDELDENLYIIYIDKSIIKWRAILNDMAPKDDEAVILDVCNDKDRFRFSISFDGLVAFSKNHILLDDKKYFRLKCYKGIYSAIDI